MALNKSLDILEEVNRYLKSKLDTQALVRLYNRVTDDILNEADFQFMKHTDNLAAGLITRTFVHDYKSTYNSNFEIIVDNVKTILREGTDFDTVLTDEKRTAEDIKEAFNKVTGIRTERVGQRLDTRRKLECNLFTVVFNRFYDFSIEVFDFAALTGKTITLTIGGTPTVITEGVEWTAATDDETTAASISTAITAIAGVNSDIATNNLALALINDLTGFTLSAVTTNADSTDLAVTDLSKGTVVSSGIEQFEYLLSNINDQDLKVDLVKKVYTVKFDTIKDDTIATAAGSDTQFGQDFTTFDILGIEIEISDWKVQGNRLIFKKAPGNGTLQIETLHFANPLTLDNLSTHIPEIPLSQRDVITTAMKMEADMESFGESPLSGLYITRFNRFLADYIGRNSDDPRHGEIDVSNKLDDGTLIPKF